MWSRPATEVAKELGITSTGLAKIARKLAVPMPPRGHWARHRAGQTLTVPALGPRTNGAPTQHAIVRRVALQDASSREEPATVAASSVLPLPAVAPEELLANAEQGLAALERVRTLRELVVQLEPTIQRLPPDAPQRRWLTDARAQIASAEQQALDAIG